MPHSSLSDAEVERIAFLSGELCEAGAELQRVIRFGYASSHPDKKETNREAVEKEIGDVVHAIILMMTNGDISPSVISKRIQEKSISCRPYLFHQDSFVDIDIPF